SGGRRVISIDHVDLKPHELGSSLVISRRITDSASIFERNAFPLDPAALCKRTPEWFIPLEDRILVTASHDGSRKNSNPRHFFLSPAMCTPTEGSQHRNRKK